MYSHFSRDISSDISGVKNTFSGWDQCMAKTYCKWPAIVGIVLGCLIALSIVWCLVRCLCCGAECCCGCLSCLSCCTSCCRGSGSRRNRGGYTQPESAPQFPQYTQYQPAPPPVYAQPQYAHFGSPNNARSQQKFNEDSLPAMPGWDSGRTKQVEDVEMGRMGQADPMIPKAPSAHVQGYPYQSNGGAYGGDLGARSPYHQEQYGYGQTSPYESPELGYSQTPTPPYQSRMQSPVYAPSVAPPPSYHTTAPAVGRKPLANTWRDV